MYLFFLEGGGIGSLGETDGRGDCRRREGAKRDGLRERGMERGMRDNEVKEIEKEKERQQGYTEKRITPDTENNDKRCDTMFLIPAAS